MPHQLFENVTKFNVPGYELAKQIHTLKFRTWDKFARQQLDAFALGLDAGVKQLRLAGQVQAPGDFFAGQMQLAQEYAEQIMESAREATVAISDVQREWEAVVDVGREQAAPAKTKVGAKATGNAAKVTPAPKLSELTPAPGDAPATG